MRLPRGWRSCAGFDRRRVRSAPVEYVRALSRLDAQYHALSRERSHVILEHCGSVSRERDRVGVRWSPACACTVGRRCMRHYGAWTATAHRPPPPTSVARALRGRHRHRGPLPAADGVEDVLRLLDRLRRRAAEQPRLPGLPRAAGRAAGHQPAGRRARPRDRRWRSGPRPRTRPAGTARTTSTRTCRRATRSASTTCRSPRTAADLRDVRWPVHRRASPAPTSRRTRPSSSTRRPDGARVSLVDFNRSGRAADGDRDRAGRPDRRAGAALRRGAPAAAAHDRRVRRGHGARPAARSRPTSRSGRAAREPFGTRVEVKNMNSFRSVERAVALRDRAPGGGPRRRRAARPWRPAAGHDDRGETYRMRVKETSDDYRYFPEPDLPPLRVDPAWLDEIRAGLPELPAARRARYRGALGLSRLRRGGARRRPGRGARCSRRRSPPMPALDAEAGRELGHRRLPAAAQRRRAARSTVDPAQLAGLDRGSSATADLAGERRRRSSSGTSPTRRRRGAIVDALGLARSPTPARSAADVDEVIAANPAAVADFRAGKAQAVGFLVGQVMKATRGQANAAVAQAAVRERLAASEGELTGVDEPRAVGRRRGARSSIGYARARGPWARYQALKEQDANIARYESWRGGSAATRHDRRVGRDGDPPPPGADRDRRRRSSGSSSSSWASSSASGGRRPVQPRSPCSDP